MVSSFRRFVGRVAVGALAVAVPVVMTPVAASAAAPTDLFFSEYVEGSGNNKALEIYNGTGGTVDLAAGGYTIQGFANGSPTASSTINLTGSIAPGDVRVVANPSAGATLLGLADQTSGSVNFNGDDAAALRKGTTVLDVIGQIGFDPGTVWGTGSTTTLDHTLRRHADVCAGDPDGSDVFDPAEQWDGFAQDTFDGLGSHTTTCGTEPPADDAPSVVSVTPATGGTAPATVSPTITFSEPVTLGDAAISMDCTGSGATAFTVTGGPTTWTVDPAEDLAGTCTLTVAASRVSDVDTNDPPDTMNDDATATFTVADSCTGGFTPVPRLQGSGETSPLVGQRVTTRGVVVGDYEGPSPALRGFYLQDPDGDGDPATSDAIFVFNGGNQDLVELGDLVTVTGTVGENQGQTQISVTATNVAECGTGTVTPTDVTLPMASATAFERYEGMLVRMHQVLTVTEHFQLGRFGEVLLSSGGRLRQPTNVVEPGAAANALQAQNDLDQLLVDDASQAQNPDPILFGRGGQPLSASNTLRGGDTTTDPVGVMTFTWGGASASPNAYRLRPVNALGGTVEFTAANPRPTHPADVGGDVRVVGMNLLNYFNTFDGLPDNQDTCRLGTQGAFTDCRGADTAAEFARQWPKTVKAILAMDPDVIGVNEIENDGYGPDSALADLVGKLNAATAPGTYAYVDADAETGQVDALGTDAIKVGQIYKPAKVTRVGDTAVLNSTEFVNGGDPAPRSRPSLAQAYRVNATGGVFIADINHLKSKGSACSVPDAGDGQGNCSAARTVAAKALATWLASDPTGTGDQDVLLVGDYNSYAKEDPIRALESAGFTNLIEDRLGAEAYSYVFDGQWGYLDHALGSQSIRSQVTGVSEYHINADEPSVLDYNTDFKTPNLQSTLYAPDQYRVSDHDPVVVGLSPNSPATVTAAFDDASVSCGTGNASLTVGITDRDPADTHTATIAWGDGSSETVDPASASFTRTHTYAEAGRYTATVTVTDSHGHVTTTTADVVVELTATGLLPPFKDGSTVKAGSTVPLKVGFTDCDGSVPTDLAPTVTISLGGSTVLTGTMTFTDGKWQYDLKTSHLPNPTGTYTVTVTVPKTGQTVTGTLILRR
ncbi:MAG TPA: ExeM/NucH family extracellular endonuclease [Ornithinibacter sp.]|nr:ExeM/NucH family extracellular endonuclease [Ornithinibacter sp.]